MVRGALTVLVVALLSSQAAALATSEVPTLSGALVPADEPRVARWIRVDPVHAAWSIDLGLSLGAGKGVTTPAAKEKAVCGLGDVDGDGNDDILVRVKKTDDHHKFEALAGPDFTRVLWTAMPSDKRLLTCGADVTGDGVSDPITITEPTAAPNPVPDSPATTGDATTTTNIPLDGADGQELADIAVDSSLSEAAAGPAEGGTTTTGQVVPAGAGALLVVGATDTGATASAADASVTQSQATVQVVDQGGAVLGTIETPAEADAVAAAPAPAADGPLPEVVVLTEVVAVPLDGVPVGVPTVTLYEGDGTEQWSSQQEATAGVPVVLPDAGDVDGDGVVDVIYATVPADVATAPSGGFQVLSGDDGTPITGSGDAQDGLVTALPFGDVDDDNDDEILVIEQPAAGDPVALSAERGDGSVVWTVQLDAEATPGNTVADEESGNTVGFSDLTGDGVPDVLITTPTGSGTSVEVIDGATGNVVWDDVFEGADSVTTVPGDDGGDDLIVLDSDGGLAVTNVDGATGETTWESAGTGPSSPAVSVTPVGDVDHDGVEDILVSIGQPDADGAVDPDQPGSSYIISGDSGEPLWTGTHGEGEDAVALHGDLATEEVTPGEGGDLRKQLVLAGFLLLLVGVAAALLVLRHRGKKAKGRLQEPDEASSNVPPTSGSSP